MSDSRFYNGQDLEALSDLRNYQNWIMESFLPYLKGTVLEVGAGTGNISRYYVGQVERALLLEPAANLIDILQKRFAGHDRVEIIARVLQKAMHTNPAQLEAGRFDAAIMVNVLEHIEDDLGLLKRLHRLLRPGGHLLIFVPALPWLYGSLDKVCGHVQRYSRPRLAAILKQSGFMPKRLHYFDAPGVVPWFVVGRLLKQRHFVPAQARHYDRLAVPLVSRLEKRIKPLFGKNLLCIAAREE